jgi:hypothetical protein
MKQWTMALRRINATSLALSAKMPIYLAQMT